MSILSSPSVQQRTLSYKCVVQNPKLISAICFSQCYQMVFQKRPRTILPQRDEIDIFGEDQANNNNGIANKLRKLTQINKKTRCVTLLGMIAVWSVASSLDGSSNPKSYLIGGMSGMSAAGTRGPKGSRFSRLLKAFHAPEELNDWIDGMELGWDSPPPQWMVDLCPDVVDHYTRFPSIKAVEPQEIHFLPFLPTLQAAQSVCTMKVLKDILSSINAQVYLHAGSHLGAVVHGQPIPWDDDVDMIMDFRKRDELKEICGDEGILIHHSGVRLMCQSGIYYNAYKVWIHYDGMKKYPPKNFPWYSPFIDLFFFKILEDGRLWEVRPNGDKHQESYAVEEYFPTRPYYFGGEYFFGPHASIPEDRYNLEICVLATYNHRVEKPIGKFGHNVTAIEMLDCDRLSKKFSFRDSMKELLSTSGGPLVQEIYPSIAADMDTVVVPAPAIREREEWAKQPDERGQKLTDALLKDINKVEVDNSISPNRHCQGPLKVVELNLKRGRHWMEASSLPNVKEADVIILNEMDIGMARSDNQHTTRLMAHYLGMNYAWGLEFIELTQGNMEDRWNAKGLYDFQGLHGNAFLTRCMISDTMIVRNGDIGEYFSSKASSINARGTEKRLGGRMGLFGRIVVDGNREVVVGSVNKLWYREKEVKDYIRNRDAIVAGGQPGDYCRNIGLQNIVSTEGGKEAHFTWPASCDSLGKERGDNICSNMGVVEDEVTTKPCMTSFGFSTQIGDHALTSVVLGEPLVSGEGIEDH